MTTIAIVKGNDRISNIKEVLTTLRKNIDSRIKRKASDTLFIKINAIDIRYPVACTHPHALETILEYFHNKFDNIIIGDNSFAFSQNLDHPYNYLANKFENLKFSDLREFDSKKVYFDTLHGRAVGRISLLPQKAFTISLALPKTHDTFVFTACSKNMMGCVISGRSYVHGLRAYERLSLNKVVQSNRLNVKNLMKVIENTKPDFSILDGFTGMDGNGPILGNEVKLGIAMGSDDAIALDSVAAKIVGFETVPYLHSPDNIQIASKGFKHLDEIKKKFRPHYLYKYQIMSELDTLIPKIDTRLLVYLMKRSYRIKDKLVGYLSNR